MLNENGFNEWASAYDESVRESAQEESYPFAGYGKVLETIFQAASAGPGKKLLDVGFGTAALTHRFYSAGAEISGIDFSETMCEIAQRKMPKARLIQHDFSNGFPSVWKEERFDCIVCTYAIHHLTPEKQIRFLHELLAHLSDSGVLLIGDVAFETAQEREICRCTVGEEWDEEESYPAAEEWKTEFPHLLFRKISFCAGVFLLRP